MQTILYVDDEPALCRAFERALRGPGVRIITTTSAPAALEMLGREPLDVVASDYRMPELNGIEILRAARRHAPGARRLLVSGRVETEVESELLQEADVDSVVMKPWSLDELRRVVRRAAELAVLVRERARLQHELQAALQQPARLADRLAARLGVSGDHLGLSARILRVAGAYDALRAGPGVGHAEALGELRARGGLDAEVLAAAAELGEPDEH